MIIVEGCDGAGKSTLITHLSEDLELPIHERASTSLGGPVADLWGWTCRDLGSWDTQPLALYDRHPLISEYIYGPVIRGKLPEGFTHPTARGLIHMMSTQALVIFCSPPLEEVLDNVSSDTEQMPGVVDKAETLWWSYQGRRASWPGWAVDYDYTSFSGKKSYTTILRAAKLHAATFRKA